MSADNSLKLTKSAFVQKLEAEYWTKDGIVEMSIDEIINTTSIKVALTYI